MKKLTKRPHAPLEEEVVEVMEEAPALKVTPLTAEFGREDLNLLRDKLNELIAVINSL